MASLIHLSWCLRTMHTTYWTSSTDLSTNTISAYVSIEYCSSFTLLNYMEYKTVFNCIVKGIKIVNYYLNFLFILYIFSCLLNKLFEHTLVVKSISMVIVNSILFLVFQLFVLFIF